MSNITYNDILRDPKSNLNHQDVRKLFHCVNESIAKASGAGSFYGKYQAVLSGVDRYSYNTMPPNSAMSGLTFITRPKLNLTTTSIRQNRVLSMLDTLEPESIPFMIRCLLDTHFAKRRDIKDIVRKSPFLDERNPFLVPMCNNLIGSSGWPSPVMEVETTPAGFHGEDMTYARGSDGLSKTYDLNLTFREIQGGIILQMLNIWFLFMELVTKGVVSAYNKYIYEGRMCYDVSIYRFVLDPSRTSIVAYAKATGCFPKSYPMGAIFDQNEGEFYVSSMSKYSVPFVANKVEYNDPIILKEFNDVVLRYCKPMQNRDRQMVDLDNYHGMNYAGIPYIETGGGANRLKFYASPEEVEDPVERTVAELKQKIRFAEDIASSRPKGDRWYNDPIYVSEDTYRSR